MVTTDILGLEIIETNCNEIQSMNEIHLENLGQGLYLRWELDLDTDLGWIK